MWYSEKSDSWREKSVYSLRLLINLVQEVKVFFGAWVILINKDVNTLFFRVVGANEIYGEKSYVSVNVPIVRAFLGKSVGDEVVVDTSETSTEWKIVNIRYGFQSSESI